MIDWLLILSTIAFVALIAFLANYFKRGSPAQSITDALSTQKCSGDGTTEQHAQSASRSIKAKSESSINYSRRKEVKVFTHPWLASTLKGHGSHILDLDFSPNGKYLVTVSEDRSIFLWSVKEFKQKTHKFSRGNVEFDHAKLVKFSPDSRALVTCLANANTVRVFKFTKKDDSSDVSSITPAIEDFPQMHTTDIISIGIATNGKFIMTCDGETKIIIWDLKGSVLAKIDTSQMKNNFAAVSPCGRFVASCGFTPDVKVWEVEFDKGGNFRSAPRAFELKGHSAGVHSFTFSGDSHRMATVSKDGTWKFWNTEVEYKKSQDPYLILTGRCQDIDCSSALIALSPDARTVVIVHSFHVAVFSTATGAEDMRISDVHTECIRAVQFHSSSRYFVTTGDKHVHVFHNVPGLHATIAEFEGKKKTATTQAMKERLQQQIEEARSLLQEITC